MQMRYYPSLISEKDLTAFCTNEWQKLDFNGRVDAAQKYADDVAEIWHVHPVTVEPYDDREMNNSLASYHTDDDGSHVLRIKESAFSDEYADHYEFAGAFVSYNVSHEMIHRRQDVMTKDGTYIPLDASFSKYTMAEMKGALSHDRRVIAMPVLFPVKGSGQLDTGRFIGFHPELMTAMYVFSPPEREAMSGSTNMLYQFCDVWNEHGMHICPADIDDWNIGNDANLQRSYTAMAQWLNYYAGKEVYSPYTYMTDDNIEAVCHEVAKVYGDEPGQDPDLKGMMHAMFASAGVPYYSDKFSKKLWVRADMTLQKVNPLNPDRDRSMNNSFESADRSRGCFFMTREERIRVAEEMQDRVVSGAALHWNHQKNDSDLEK